MKNILVAIDFSNATDAVIHQIGKLACPNDSIVHLLHIVEPSICYEVSGVLPDEVPVPVMDQTEENEVMTIAKNHLKKTAEKLSRLTDATIIQAVEDSTLRTLLEYRYINGKKWEEIALMMGYDYRYILKIHGKALSMLPSDLSKKTLKDTRRHP